MDTIQEPESQSQTLLWLPFAARADVLILRVRNGPETKFWEEERARLRESHRSPHAQSDHLSGKGQAGNICVILGLKQGSDQCFRKPDSEKHFIQVPDTHLQSLNKKKVKFFFSWADPPSCLQRQDHSGRRSLGCSPVASLAALQGAGWSSALDSHTPSLTLYKALAAPTRSKTPRSFKSHNNSPTSLARAEKIESDRALSGF